MATPFESNAIANCTTDEEIATAAKSSLDKLRDIDPNNVQCMLGIVVSKADENNQSTIQAFVLGADDEIGRMLTSLVTITRNGLVHANAPSNPDGEVPN